MMAYKCTDDMLYYSGWIGNSILRIEEDSDSGNIEYAIVDGDKLIEYFGYTIDWYSSNAGCFGLFSFDRGNKIVGLDVHRELKSLLKNCISIEFHGEW